MSRGDPRAHAGRGSTTSCSCSTTPPTTARAAEVERWNGRPERTWRAPAPDRPRPAHRQGRQRLPPAARSARRALPAAQRGLRAVPRCGRGAGRGAAPQIPRRRSRERSCSIPRARPSRRRGGCRDWAPRWRARSSSIAARSPRAMASAPARSAGCSRRRCSSDARRSPRSATSTPTFFVYSDETDLCKRLRDTGWRILWVPGAEAIHHEQLATDRAAAERRVVEFHRGRDRYLRKHHSPAVALVARVLAAWSYWRASPCRTRTPGPRPSPLPRSRARGPAPRPRRGHARSGGGLQPAGCESYNRSSSPRTAS